MSKKPDLIFMLFMLFGVGIVVSACTSLLV